MDRHSLMASRRDRVIIRTTSVAWTDVHEDGRSISMGVRRMGTFLKQRTSTVPSDKSSDGGARGGGGGTDIP